MAYDKEYYQNKKQEIQQKLERAKAKYWEKNVQLVVEYQGELQDLQERYREAEEMEKASKYSEEELKKNEKPAKTN